jgi:hypothetical protein
MLTISEWNELFKIVFGVFLITLITLYVLGTIAENKKLKSKLRAKKSIQVNPKMISNYNAFVKENTKNMTLYEIKEFKKNLNLELNRMILRGVR